MNAPACMAVCGKLRVSRDHQSTAAHRAAAARLADLTAGPERSRPGWMIAIRDYDRQYAGRWPSYAPVVPGPLLADAERGL